jgi:hypothetical protein
MNHNSICVRNGLVSVKPELYFITSQSGGGRFFKLVAKLNELDYDSHEMRGRNSTE